MILCFPTSLWTALHVWKNDRIPFSDAYMLIRILGKPVAVGMQLLNADSEILFEGKDKSLFFVETRF